MGEGAGRKTLVSCFYKGLDLGEMDWKEYPICAIDFIQNHTHYCLYFTPGKYSLHVKCTA